jgi:hypothetical protein
MSSDENNQNQGGLLNQVANTILNVGANGNNITRYATIAGTALAGGALYYYMNRKGPKVADGIDYSNQSREVEVRRQTKIFKEKLT